MVWSGTRNVHDVCLGVLISPDENDACLVYCVPHRLNAARRTRVNQNRRYGTQYSL